MRELHERLASLGHLETRDASDDFGSATVAVVEAFQRTRGLPITGEVDATTWGRLVEAGWRLGQRLLYLTSPYQRGDDVADLQVRLAQLGFNPGRIDGIFGPLLESALQEFQRDCALEVDATLGRTTLVELIRLTSTTDPRSLVNEARDRAGFDDVPSGPLVICGASPLADVLARAIGPMMKTILLKDERPEVVAALANTSAAALVISLQSLDHIEGVHLHYWAGYRTHSRRGERLASAIAAAFTDSRELPRVEVTGMALPILRETRMTTLHIEHSGSGESDLEELGAALADVIVKVIHR